MILDWSPMVEAILADVKNGTSVATISAKFHNALVEGMVAVAKAFRPTMRHALRAVVFKIAI